MWTIGSHGEQDTRALGVALGAVVEEPVVVALVGGLGAGKTCFAQGAGEGLGVEEPVVSPTFVLLAEYEGRLPLLHGDAYRLRPEEALGIGLEEQLETWPGLALLEWPERVPDALPVDHVRVVLHTTGPTARRIEVTVTGPHHEALVARWRARWESAT